MLMTTGNSFEGYRVERYLGVISKDVIFRSGVSSSIGAAVEDFLRSFSLRDIELNGSSDLIKKAKNYVLEQIEKEAAALKANAILGIDIETSFGTDLARVAINGTAVFVVNEETGREAESPDDQSDEEAGMEVRAANIWQPLVPVCVHFGSLTSRTAALEIMQTGEGQISDIQADLLLRNRFDDEFLVENACFLDFRETALNRFVSQPYRIIVPDHILCCIRSCDVIVKKYLFDGTLCVPEGRETRALTEVQQEMRKGITPREIYEILSQAHSVMEMMGILDTLELDQGGEPYLTIHKVLTNRLQLERMYGVPLNGTLKVLRETIDKM